MKRSHRMAAAALTLLATLIVGCGDSADTATLDTVTPEQAAEVLAESPGAILLDIRTPEEFASERIAGSENVDFYAADFADRLATLDRSETYVVYCRSGNRSAAAMDVFADLGFETVYEVDGGIVSWVAAGLPIS